MKQLASFARAVPYFMSGARTPREFLEQCLETLVAREPTVKAFVTLNLDAARAAADLATARYRAGRPLSIVDGCPVGIKDIMDTSDMPTQMGSALFAGWQPRYDAACVQAMRHGGAVIVGKTVTTEFACGGPGATTNPFDATRTPGGSSSGSAAAVGAGMLPVALGTQTQGSTLRPASYCGVVGFKPTHGALTMAGVHPISTTHDHLGVLGATGRGVREHFGLAADEVDLWMGTLSKAFASCGGFVAGRHSLIETLRYFTPGFMFSVGLPPPAAASALAALYKLTAEPARARLVRARADHFRDLAREHGWSIGLSRDSAIVPLIVGNSEKALRLSAALMAAGINVQPIVYPGVAHRQARLRFFFCCDHTEAEIRQAASAVTDALRQL